VNTKPFNSSFPFVYLMMHLQITVLAVLLEKSAVLKTRPDWMLEEF